ncbi:MAG TPA: sigma-70 family RNA polymerase sigma factor [Nitrospiria bacterium]|nr:sigma-70 family RNA polymerase sigma factor [Nitrospiria bacterium]
MKEQSFNWMEVFQRTRKDLHAFVSRLVGGCEAEDILQDTWLNVFQRGNPEAWRNPRAFLFATAKNLSLDLLRRRRRWERLVVHDGAPEKVFCSRPGPDAVANSKQLASMIAEALEELPPACRESFFLNRLCNLTHSEIAERLGISTKTVQRHIERALLHCLGRMNQADANRPD